MTTPQATERYKIVSSFDLPFRLKGSFTYREAYELACEWSRYHDVRDMAWLVERLEDDRQTGNRAADDADFSST